MVGTSLMKLIDNVIPKRISSYSWTAKTDFSISWRIPVSCFESRGSLSGVYDISSICMYWFLQITLLKSNWVTTVGRQPLLFTDKFFVSFKVNFEGNLS